MRMTGRTIVITGGGSGIGRGLAERFHRLGNKVIVAGRDAAKLDAVAAANPGIATMSLDVGDELSIQAFAARIVATHPALDVLINNAGILPSEDLRQAPANVPISETTIATNLLGPIRLTSLLLPHLCARPESTVIMVSSGLAFVPMATSPTYCATKAALHAYTLALREQLKAGSTGVIEIVPPYVQTMLTGAHQASDPRAMPLEPFIDEVMAMLAADPDAGEIVVEACRPLRYAARNGDFEAVFAELNAPR